MAKRKTPTESSETQQPEAPKERKQRTKRDPTVDGGEFKAMLTAGEWKVAETLAARGGGYTPDGYQRDPATELRRLLRLAIDMVDTQTGEIGAS